MGFDPHGFGQVMVHRLNSATKYPSIETYHTLDPRTGLLLDQQAMPFPIDQPIVLTEKVDGTNGRVAVLPDGDFFIGSREELIYSKGDRIENPIQGIVPALLPLADWLKPQGNWLTVYFLEVYGHQISGAAKQYTSLQKTGYRLFDIAFVPLDTLSMERDKISSWREHGGQRFATEATLLRAKNELDIPLTPRLATIGAEDLPTDLAGMEKFLRFYAPYTNVALDAGALGAAEGIVLRTEDRSVIAKARFQDYRRTLHPQPRKKEGKQWRKDEQDTVSSTSLSISPRPSVATRSRLMATGSRTRSLMPFTSSTQVMARSSS